MNSPAERNIYISAGAGLKLRRREPSQLGGAAALLAFLHGGNVWLLTCEALVNTPRKLKG